MKSVMKMYKKVNTKHLLIGMIFLFFIFGCKCAMKKMNTGLSEGFKEAAVGYDGDRLVCCLASWCGHCKSLKASGELDKLKENPDVPVEINEDDDAANKKYGVKGFPSVMMVKEDGTQIPFKGPRTADAMVEFFKNN